MEIEFGEVIPVFRVFSVEKAKEFYQGFLGFKVDWEHRFGDNFPLYMRVSRGGLALHLTEHHGDCCPGGLAMVQMKGIRAFHAELAGKGYRYMHPGVQEAEWGALVMEVIDPFGNKIRFSEPKA